MSDDLSGVSNELQVSHFGFSALSFHDCVFNLTVNAWENVCKKEFETNLKNLQEKYKRRIITFPFQNEKTRNSFHSFKIFCVTDVFRIPNTVTLPEFKIMQKSFAEYLQGDEKEYKPVELEFEKKFERIRQIREKLARVDRDIQEYQDCTDVLHTIERSQEKIMSLRRQTICSPVRASPV